MDRLMTPAEARSQWGALLRAVEAGERVGISRGGRVVAVLGPAREGRDDQVPSGGNAPAIPEATPSASVDADPGASPS
jgi:antitoxin (DNA-binding transcriptional repressor) of toxin-antitoxin stability system